MEELQKDLIELEALEASIERQRNKNMVSVEIKKLQSEITKLLEAQTNSSSKIDGARSTGGIKCYEHTIKNYAWDQSSKFVKFYVTLPSVQKIDSENVSCTFTNKSLKLKVHELDNKDYVFTINNLLKEINPDASNWKVKTDMVIINAAKVGDLKWDFVTELDKRASEKTKPKIEPNEGEDPTDGLMKLMKTMYDQGDDEMKRSITKAWYESRNKVPMN